MCQIKSTKVHYRWVRAHADAGPGGSPGSPMAGFDQGIARKLLGILDQCDMVERKLQQFLWVSLMHKAEVGTHTARSAHLTAALSSASTAAAQPSLTL